MVCLKHIICGMTYCLHAWENKVQEGVIFSHFSFSILFFFQSGDPHNDPNAQGDAFKTLFVARVVSGFSFFPTNAWFKICCYYLTYHILEILVYKVGEKFNTTRRVNAFNVQLLWFLCFLLIELSIYLPELWHNRIQTEARVWSLWPYKKSK